ncbi:hypothetical protein [Aerosakkonema funiforme]|uniref:hypothetical protein n=1 Tax=Aerosakkonema funiforme TaxID=1246630 RepID=UPI0016847CDB|nr:hypothetical protein [Aerosakkonema funiforme]
MWRLYLEIVNSKSSHTNTSTYTFGNHQSDRGTANLSARAARSTQAYWMLFIANFFNFWVWKRLRNQILINIIIAIESSPQGDGKQVQYQARGGSQKSKVKKGLGIRD